MKIHQTVVLVTPGCRQKDKQCGLHIKHSFLYHKECLNAVKPAYNKTTRNWNFFHCMQITLNMCTWKMNNLDFRSVGLHKSFPWKTHFQYAWISFKQGFNVLNIYRKFCEGQIIIVQILILFTWHPFGDCSRQIWKGEKLKVKCTLV